MPQWTNEQLKAIKNRDCSHVVSAAAGSGKTAVLVERVCHYLVQLRGDIDRLLIVTFTEAAANEMRQRIAAALRVRLADNPADRHLARQLALLPGAHISTIHSFCLWLLRRYFYRLDLDPAFRVMDDGEDRLLKLEVLQDLLEERYQSETTGSPFYNLVDRYSDERGESLENLTLALHEYAQSQVFPAVWLQAAAQAFVIPPGTALESLSWYKVVREEALAKIQAAVATLQAALELAAQPGGPEHYHKAILADLAMLSELHGTVQKGTWDQAVAAFRGLDFQTARAGKSRSGEEIDQMLLEQVKGMRENAKKSLRNLANGIYTRSAEQMLTDLRDLQAPASALSELVSAFAQRYQQAKHARSLVSFADLERFALQLLMEQSGVEADTGPSGQTVDSNLQPSETAKELQEQFVEVLCDEYQDINRVQDAILGLLAGEHGCGGTRPNTFMVGDVKQSIYRFRLAEPRIFLTRCRKCDDQQLINLAANFRCRRTVVDGVNLLFRLLMSSAVGDVDYDDAAALVFRANYPPIEPNEPPTNMMPSIAAEPPIEAIFLEGDPRLIDDARQGAASRRHTPSAAIEEESAEESTAAIASENDEFDLTALEREAAYIARRIHALVEGHHGEPFMVWDKEKETYRPVRYRDVVVLLRATHVKASQFVDIFRSEGVPLYAETGTGYFRAPEVETMLALLAVIDNPRQDLPLAGVLRSPIAGLDAGQLAEIRLAAPDGDFFDALATRATQEDGLGRKLAEFLAQLDAWRTRARRSTLADLIWSIYRDTSFYDYCGGMPGGRQRQANLRALYDRARQFDQFARHGLLRFLQFINDLRTSGEDLGSAPTLGENEDVVRLMSIHKSKGLEFPVVFVAGLGTQFNQQDLRGQLLFDRELGYGPQIVDPASHTRADTLASLGVRESMRRASLSEEMRILYVALTRARERLYLVATVQDVITTLERWRQVGRSMQGSKQLPVYQATAAKRYTDWIGPVLASIEDLLPEVTLSSAGEVVSGTAPGWQVTLYPPAAVAQEFGSTVPDGINTEYDLGNGVPSGKASKANVIDPLDTGHQQLAAETVRRLQSQLTWKYPWAGLSGVAARITVTELKRREAQVSDPEHPAATPHRPPVFRRPVFLLHEGKLSATEIGTATHMVLQHLPLTAPITPTVVAQCVADLVERSFLTEAEGASVDQHAIVQFFASPLGARLCAAEQVDGWQVLREAPFSLAIPAEELPGISATMGAMANVSRSTLAQTGDVAILQGVIDCMFQEQDGWVLLDFKTDRLKVANLEEVARQRYAAQVRWYARAAQQALGIHVTECHLCMLAHNTTVSIDRPMTLESVG